MSADMENTEEMEMLLWDYIDGRCNAAVKERVSELIAGDEVWAVKYNELMAFNTGVQQSVVMEQPSMRFTKNIMEAVAATQIAPATKNYINFGIIKGIAAFFFCAITGLCVVAFSGTNWHNKYTTSYSPKVTTNINLNLLGDPIVMNLMIVLGILLALLLTDNLLRSRKAHS